jgi:hypothetical protein
MNDPMAHIDMPDVMRIGEGCSCPSCRFTCGNSQASSCTIRGSRDTTSDAILCAPAGGPGCPWKHRAAEETIVHVASDDLSRRITGTWLFLATSMLAPCVAPAQEPWLLLGLVAPAGPVELSTLGYVLGDLNLRGGTIEVRRHLGPGISVASGYMLNHRDVADRRTREHRARLDLTLRAHAGRLRLAGRSLFERRWSRTTVHDAPRSRASASVLRVRLRADVPTRRRLVPAPFATIEPFYDLGAARVSRTWLGVGVGSDVGPLRLEPYYLRRLERDGPRMHTAALSATMRRSRRPR